MAMPVTRHWTVADVRELTREDRPWPRYELIDGELLVTPAPQNRHQITCQEIWKLLDAYVTIANTGLAVMSPSDLELRTGTITQPDVFVAPFDTPIASVFLEWSDVRSLLLAVEVLSPSSLRTDRVVKRDFYLANHVDEYWIVDIDARVIERWRPVQETPELHRAEIAWSPIGRAPLVIDVQELFDTIDAKARLLPRP